MRPGPVRRGEEEARGPSASDFLTGPWEVVPCELHAAKHRWYQENVKGNTVRCEGGTNACTNLHSLPKPYKLFPCDHIYMYTWVWAYAPIFRPT